MGKLSVFRRGLIVAAWATTTLTVNAQQKDEFQLTLDSINAYTIHYVDESVDKMWKDISTSNKEASQGISKKKGKYAVYKALLQILDKKDIDLLTKDSGINQEQARNILKYRKLEQPMTSKEFSSLLSLISLSSMMTMLSGEEENTDNNEQTVKDKEFKNLAQKAIAACKFKEQITSAVNGIIENMPNMNGISAADKEKTKIVLNLMTKAMEEKMPYVMQMFYTKDQLKQLIYYSNLDEVKAFRDNFTQQWIRTYAKKTKDLINLTQKPSAIFQQATNYTDAEIEEFDKMTHAIKLPEIKTIEPQE